MRKLRLALLSVLVTTVPGTVLAQNASPPVPHPPTEVVGVYTVEHLHLEEAAAHALSQCPPPVYENCHIDIKKGFFEVLADPSVQAKVAAILKEKDVPPPRHLLQAILIRADGNESEPRALQLPDDARKAIEDLSSVLVFKNYRSIGTARAASDGGIIDFSVGEGFRMQVESRVDRATGNNIKIDRFQLTKEGIDRPLMSTTLNMRLGETVVVGSSTLGDGQEALIVLLTALPMP